MEDNNINEIAENLGLPEEDDKVKASLGFRPLKRTIIVLVIILIVIALVIGYVMLKRFVNDLFGPPCFVPTHDLF